MNQSNKKQKIKNIKTLHFEVNYKTFPCSFTLTIHHIKT